MNKIMNESKKQPIIFIILRMSSPKKKQLVSEDGFSCWQPVATEAAGAEKRPMGAAKPALRQP